MDSLFLLLLLVSLVLLVIGIFSPKTSLFWEKKTQTKKKSAITYGFLAIVFFILFGISSDSNRDLTTRKNPSSTNKSTNNEIPTYKNIDNLKSAFSSPPFNFIYQSENAFSDKNVTIKGFESSDITDATTNNHILLQF